MPRLRRCVEPRDVLHVFNRSVNRDTLFHAADDYAYFVDLVLESRRRFGLEVFTFCAMPNHWHLLLRAEATGDLSASLHWITFKHATYFRAVQKSVGNGHVYQGRFHSKVIVGERYFVTAARYIETNPVRAGLAATPEEWTWSSVGHRAKQELDAPPISLPAQWTHDRSGADAEEELRRAHLLSQARRRADAPRDEPPDGEGGGGRTAHRGARDYVPDSPRGRRMRAVASLACARLLS